MLLPTYICILKTIKIQFMKTNHLHYIVLLATILDVYKRQELFSSYEGKFSSLSRKTQNILFQYFTFLIEEHRTFSSLLVCQNNLICLLYTSRGGELEGGALPGSDSCRGCEHTLHF